MKPLHLYSFLRCLLCLCASNLLVADVIDASLVLRFNFDAAPVGGVIADTSPAGGHPGANTSAAWAATEGTRTGVMSFDGTVPSQITVAPPAYFNSWVGAITFWMKSSLVTPSPNPYAIIFDRRETPGGGGDLLYQGPDGKLADQAEAASRAKANALTTAANVTDGKWHHIAYIYDQSASGSISLFVDGLLDVSGVNTRAWSWVQSQQIAIGTSPDTFWSGFTGFLDDFRIYKRALTAAEGANIAGFASP